MKKLIAMTAALVICSTMCAYAESSVSKVKVAATAATEAEVAALSALRVEITSEPDDPVKHGESELDLTGLTISVYETYSNGNVAQTLTNATLEEVRKQYPHCVWMQRHGFFCARKQCNTWLHWLPYRWRLP